jgi:hypothetical protein
MVATHEAHVMPLTSRETWDECGCWFDDDDEDEDEPAGCEEETMNASKPISSILSVRVRLDQCLGSYEISARSA